MIIKALIIAFAMYSKIPMPKVDWDNRSMRYALCFFPLIGVIIGGVVCFAGKALNGRSSLLYGSVMTVIPLLITGGIHFDGFLDTVDSLSSYGDRQKRLEILKDPHIGAFALIGGLIYMSLSIGLWSEVKTEDLIFISCGYVLSRALSALSVVILPKAKNEGLVSAFKDSAGRGGGIFTSVLYIVAAAFIMCRVGLHTALWVAVAAVIVFIYHIYNCKNNFGGITGDLAGYFLQLCELVILAVAIV